MTVIQRPADRLSVVREVAFPLLAVAVVVASTDLRIPLGLPGHRGLIWVTMLVAVALVTERRETVLAVGAASSIAALPMHGLSDPLWSSRYVAGAVLLYAVASLPVVWVHRWLLVVAAAPINLVALASSMLSWRSAGSLSAWASNEMLEKAGWHLIFGFVAGLLAWLVAGCVSRRLPVRVAEFFAGSRYRKRPL
ncbi:hypothetical protein [Mycobacterium sherrisii]|uniref:Uncharacterized protein n=1 Tax=Mycobacterium sherrisii TaxID=243061 RepID=A0A1E3SPX2_9MYCO|nr:hypothetical protein [Mycobacterium sherrisii]MCV7027664.1 hypothetical protein [Mycobacterium sherrisii]MEC4764824.1 hypothetical protein [Mycobacterium sherrisii]ODR03663.1 hypothetical protein BHQ21_21035 [Mycobacterium sherrisii]ORW72510.1 hypothetical protein AWC25_18790 [Mycobacterium sherrisii]